MIYERKQAWGNGKVAEDKLLLYFFLSVTYGNERGRSGAMNGAWWSQGEAARRCPSGTYYTATVEVVKPGAVHQSNIRTCRTDVFVQGRRRDRAPPPSGSHPSSVALGYWGVRWLWLFLISAFIHWEHDTLSLIGFGSRIDFFLSLFLWVARQLCLLQWRRLLGPA